MWSSNVLAVSKAGHEFGQFLMYDRWKNEHYDQRQLAGTYRALTLGFLPEAILTQYNFKFGTHEQQIAKKNPILDPPDLSMPSQTNKVCSSIS